MKLHFFGCGSAFNPAMGNTSAWFEMDGCLFLVDCGETVYELLMKRSDLREYRQIYVLLTHLHADHVGSLGSLISYNYCILGRKICVIHPRATVVELLRLMGIKDEFYNYYQELPEDVGCLRAEPVPVEHADNMDCFGYILETEGMRIITAVIPHGCRSGLPACLRTGSWTLFTTIRPSTIRQAQATATWVYWRKRCRSS